MLKLILVSSAQHNGILIFFGVYLFYKVPYTSSVWAKNSFYVLKTITKTKI